MQQTVPSSRGKRGRVLAGRDCRTSLAQSIPYFSQADAPPAQPEEAILRAAHAEYRKPSIRR